MLRGSSTTDSKKVSTFPNPFCFLSARYERTKIKAKYSYPFQREAEAGSSLKRNKTGRVLFASVGIHSLVSLRLVLNLRDRKEQVAKSIVHYLGPSSRASASN